MMILEKFTIISQIFTICEMKYGYNCNNSACFAVHMALILLLSQRIVNKIIIFPVIPVKKNGKMIWIYLAYHGESIFFVRNLSIEGQKSGQRNFP